MIARAFRFSLSLEGEGWGEGEIPVYKSFVYTGERPRLRIKGEAGSNSPLEGEEMSFH